MKVYGISIGSDGINAREEEVVGSDEIKERKRSTYENGAKRRGYISSYHHY